MNTFGSLFRLTTFGESHGPAIGGVIDGMPPGVAVDLDALQVALDARRPGSRLVSQRREADRLEVLSGILNGVSLGTPIGFIIRNTDCRPSDYDSAIYRQSHADFTTQARYGVRDPRGGGRASARETACRVVGGALADAVLSRMGVRVCAWTASIGEVETDFEPSEPFATSDLFCPDSETARRMEAALEAAREGCDTLGGVVKVAIFGVPPGIGSPVYGKMSAMLAEAMMGINAAKGVEIGMGFDGARRRGSEMIDLFTISPDGRILTASNHSGGLQGGISNGAPITLRVAFKPIATMPGRTLDTVTADGRSCTFTARGRHDVCALPRAVPVVRAMASMTVLDAIMATRAQNIFGP